MPTLLIHPRRGYFQLTKCQNCGYIFECENCSANLVAYRQTQGFFELVCHSCQSYYKYPLDCPSCGSLQIFSSKGGIDNLAQILTEDLNLKVTILGNSKKIPTQFENQIYLTTRIFDPAIDYSQFDSIIFINSHNLLASPDYLVLEETLKSIGEVLLQTSLKTKIYFDTYIENLDFLENLKRLCLENEKHQNFVTWYGDFLEKERKNRQSYGFYPEVNLLLLTSQNKIFTKALSDLKEVHKEILAIQRDFPEILVGDIYPARLLKRKGYYSYHLLVKFPRNYPKFLTFQKAILRIQRVFRIQIRLNPKHLF